MNDKTKQNKSTIKKYLMQGYDWNNEDPKGWYMSEKLDGVRAYWDGEQFWSKRGITYPKNITKYMTKYITIKLLVNIELLYQIVC